MAESPSARVSPFQLVGFDVVADGAVGALVVDVAVLGIVRGSLATGHGSLQDDCASTSIPRVVIVLVPIHTAFLTGQRRIDSIHVSGNLVYS